MVIRLKLAGRCESSKRAADAEELQRRRDLKLQQQTITLLSQDCTTTRRIVDLAAFRAWHGDRVVIT